MVRIPWLTLVVPLACGCDGMRADTEPVPLNGTLWQVEDIDEGGVIDRSHITLEFASNEQIGGSTGCNRYFGTLVLDGDSFRVSETGSTRRACVPAVMKQEQRFLTALTDAETYTVRDELWLEIYDAPGKRRIKAIRIEEEPAMDDADGHDPDDAQ